MPFNISDRERLAENNLMDMTTTRKPQFINRWAAIRYKICPPFGKNESEYLKICNSSGSIDILSRKSGFNITKLNRFPFM